MEWGLYCKALIYSGIQLKDRPNMLRWTGGDGSGNLTAKNVYNALASKLWSPKLCGWRRTFWVWDLAPKIKLFTWLLLEDRILTWDNLQRRGWSGPSIFYLCLQMPETTFHLMVQCRFAQQVWSMIYKVLSLKTAWTGSTLTSCFEDWIRQCSTRPSLPSLICWHLWLE
jgi:hypothetical protein